MDGTVLAPTRPDTPTFGELFAAQGAGMRWLFMLTVIWGALVSWFAPHPPMIDLPQHAGQVTLLRDMLLDQSPWSEWFRINAFTPYLIGYGLALPLAFLMPVATALKVVLSLAYIAFVFMCVKLRQRLGADSRLDWLFLVSFFGFAYRWGFFTFLVAASVGLWFILVADRYAEARSRGRAASVVAVGLLLLISHGLVFVFGLAVGAGLLAARVPRWKPLARAMLPHVMLGLACVAYYLINREVSAGLETEFAMLNVWNGGWTRIPKAIAYSVAMHARSEAVLVLGSAVVLMLAVPWLLGLRIDRQHHSSWIPFATVSAILLFVPTLAIGTAYLYERFALFLLPAYAWMFTRATPDPDPSSLRSRFATRLAVPLLVALSWTVLGFNTLNTWRFGRETAEFDAVLATLEPRQRALALIFDPNSDAAGVQVYVHYPAWYQAEKQGLTDTNFAWSPAMIVRYRPERVPGVVLGFEWHPERFDWIRHRGDDYKYIFVRHSDPLPGTLFWGARCPPEPMATSGPWTVYVRRNCS